MKKVISSLLVFLLLVIPGAAFAQNMSSAALSQPEKTLRSQLSVNQKPKGSIKHADNYLLPAGYPIVSAGGYAGALVDSFGNNQSIYFSNITTSENDPGDLDIGLTNISQDPNVKDSLVSVEFYKEEAGSLSFLGSTSFDTAGYSSAVLDSLISKLDFADQPYIYMRFGVYQNSADTNYSDSITFKIANPFYSAAGTTGTADQYEVISNESVDTSSTEPTGIFNVKNIKYSMQSIPDKGVYKLDYIKPFNPSGSQGIIRNSMLSIAPSYVVGSSKPFWVSNLTDGSYSQITAKLVYSGTKANVWVNNNQISDAEAAQLGQEFDNKIYPEVTTNFGHESDVNHDGKINILCYDIQDGFSGSGGYVAGYFYPGDLYNTAYSNQSEIFYIDTNPAMGTGTAKDVTQVYSTLAHEFQHMVNYNQKVLVQGGTQMDTWMDEGLAMASEQIFDGNGLTDRLDYYNNSTAIQNGQSLLYWDTSGDLLSNYSLSYLFFQYLKIQAGQGDAIFKELIQDPNSNYKAVEDIAKKYIDPNITFGKLMTDFRIALLLKQPTGLYGFKGDKFFDNLQDKLYSGSSENLRGGGAVVTLLNSAATLSVPSDKGRDISYNFFDISGKALTPVPAIDQTPPPIPAVHDVTDQDSIVTGLTEAGAIVNVKVKGAVIGSAAAGSDGKFAVRIPVQKAGTQLMITAKDSAGNVSDPAVAVVKDVTPPAVPTVNSISDRDVTVTGRTEAGAKVYVKANRTVIGTAAAGSDGRFTVAIPVQKAGTVLEIMAVDHAGNKSSSVFINVKSTLLHGWHWQNGSWHYYNLKTGREVTGWLKDGNAWYYLDASGTMRTGWVKSGNSWYYLDASGAMKTGWIKSGSSWYYLDGSGAMKTGWIKSGTTWYYLNGSGAMQTGWVYISHKWYYFNSSGAWIK